MLLLPASRSLICGRIEREGGRKGVTKGRRIKDHEGLDCFEPPLEPKEAQCATATAKRKEGSLPLPVNEKELAVTAVRVAVPNRREGPLYIPYRSRRTRGGSSRV